MEKLLNHGSVISGVTNFIIHVSAFNSHKTKTSRKGTGGANTTGHTSSLCMCTGLVATSKMMISSMLVQATILHNMYSLGCNLGQSLLLAYCITLRQRKLVLTMEVSSLAIVTSALLHYQLSAVRVFTLFLDFPFVNFLFYDLSLKY